MTSELNQQDQAIRDCVAEGRTDEAVTATLQAYGPEILSFLVSRLNNMTDAEEAYSLFAERLWLALPSFSWRCSLRTWSYVLARNVAISHVRSPHRLAQRRVPLSNPGVVSKLTACVRTATNRFRKTEVKDRFRALREQLAPEDQSLLVLRVDREMAWRDLAITMSGDTELSEEAIERESARLRKAFERVKRELRLLAEREGLLRGE